MKVVTLESLLSSLESGARPPGGVSAESGEIPSLGGEHLNRDGGFDFTNIKRIPGSFFERMTGGRIAPRDILVVKDGATTGKTSFVGANFPFPEAAVNEHVFRLEVNQSKASPEYVFHFLRSPLGQKAIGLDFRGATVGGISRDFATKVRLPLPNLPEQQRIAEVLDKACALREKRRAALLRLDSLTQSIFLDMFGDPATNPKGWPFGDLNELALKITDGEHLNPQFSSSGMPIVMAGDVLDDYVEIRRAKKVELRLGLKFRKKCDPAMGDLLLVSRGATIGRQCVVNTDDAFCLMGSVILIKPRRDRLESRFLSGYLKHPVIRAALYKTSGSSAQQAIYLKDLRKLRCMVPPLPLQGEFARCIDSLAKTRSRYSTCLEQLNDLFASLCHRAFEGRL